MLTGRVSIDRIIEKYYDEIIGLGFKDWWINYWLKWTRISDFGWGIDRGVPIVYFTLRELVERYIKHKWEERLGIHIKMVNEDERKAIDFIPTKIPYVTVWRKDQGIVKPSAQELEKFFIQKYNELLDIVARP